MPTIAVVLTCVSNGVAGGGGNVRGSASAGGGVFGAAARMRVSVASRMSDHGFPSTCGEGGGRCVVWSTMVLKGFSKSTATGGVGARARATDLSCDSIGARGGSVVEATEGPTDVGAGGRC